MNNNNIDVMLPMGAYPLLKDFIYKCPENWISFYKEIYPEKPIEKWNNENAFPEAWKPDYYEKGFVVAINDARLYGERGTIITPDNMVIHEYSFEWVFQKPEEHTIFQRTSLNPNIVELENAAVLTHTWSLNYYHWILEVLPRIHLLEESGLHVDKYIVNNPYQYSILNMFGIDSSKIIVTEKDTHIKVKNLIIPSQLTAPTEWACKFVRQKLLPLTTPSRRNHEKIYIARTGNRIVHNERNIIKLLKREGFEIVHLEKYHILEQARLLSEAKVVVAPHGAGLTNLIFSQPGTKVLELIPSSYIQPYFWIICKLQNLEHHYLIEEAIKYDGWPGFHDLIVDENRFSQKIRSII